MTAPDRRQNGKTLGGRGVTHTCSQTANQRARPPVVGASGTRVSRTGWNRSRTGKEPRSNVDWSPVLGWFLLVKREWTGSVQIHICRVDVSPEPETGTTPSSRTLEAQTSGFCFFTPVVLAGSSTVPLIGSTEPPE